MFTIEIWNLTQILRSLDRGEDYNLDENLITSEQ